MKLKKKYNIKIDARDLYENEIIEKIMDIRGIDEHFLNPTEDDVLPLEDLEYIKDAFNILDKHIQKKSNIAILADTDTDGITSGAIMTRYLRNYLPNENISTYINDGKSHGLINQDLDRFSGNDLLIIVDSLDKNTEQYEALDGMDIIVLDHHAIDPNVDYDDVVCLVSSQRESYSNKALSGAGVTWKFCKYCDHQYLENYADDLLDLCATGLVADMMDMRNMENRYLVQEGLKQINNLALKKIIGSYEFNSTAIAFSVAPLINAANRLNYNEYALNAFLSDDNKEVLSYMKVLKSCKEMQNEEVQKLLPDILEQCESQKNNKMIIAIIDTDYGISGLIGNKLLEIYQRPLLVLKDCDDKYMGSMRATGVDDFRKICNDSGLVIANGHELASGIEIEKKNLDKFREYIFETLTDLNTEEVIDVDAQINLTDITRTLIDGVRKLDRISGEGFKPIKFYINGINEYEVSDFSKKKHLVIKPNDTFLAIKWNFDGSFEEMEDNALMNEELEICCTLDYGFMGRTFVFKGICDEIREVE